MLLKITNVNKTDGSHIHLLATQCCHVVASIRFYFSFASYF